VGLCQWGAKGMAERGFNVDQILGFFYPGATRATLMEAAPLKLSR
jgi:stage II sporulation protein D